MKTESQNETCICTTDHQNPVYTTTSIQQFNIKFMINLLQ